MELLIYIKRLFHPGPPGLAGFTQLVLSTQKWPYRNMGFLKVVGWDLRELFVATLLIREVMTLWNRRIGGK